MEYENIETMIEEIDEEVTKLNNKIVDLTWIDKNYSKSKVKALQSRINKLIERKYELKEMLSC